MQIRCSPRLASAGWLWLCLACLVLAPGLPAYELAVKLPGPPARLRWPLKPPADPAAAAAKGLYLRFTAYTTTGTVKPVVVSIELVNGRGEWYQTARNLTVGFNAPRAIVLDLSADSADWIPSGHFRPWDGQALEGMTALEYRVSVAEPVDLKVILTPPVWHAGAGPEQPPPGLVAGGIDHARRCVRLQPVAGSAVWSGLTAAWPQAAAQGFVRQAFVAGAVSGEWHPVGGVEWAWHPPAGGAGFGPPAQILLQVADGRAWQLGTSPALAGGAGVERASAGGNGTVPPTSGPPERTGNDTSNASGTGGRPAPPGMESFGPALAQMTVDGRPLLGVSGPEPVLTGQPAHWWQYRAADRQWVLTGAASPPAVGWAWRAPNFLAAAAWLNAGEASPGGTTDCLNGEVAWAWEEALIAGERLGVTLPAVIWADRDLYEFSAFRWGLNPWRRTVLSPRLLFADAGARARQKTFFEALLTRFSCPGGVQDWRVGLTLPLEGETGLVEVYGLAPAKLPPGTAVWLSHPACLGEESPLWEWLATGDRWQWPAGWKPVTETRRYAMTAPTVTPDCVLITAAVGGGQAGADGWPATARLVLRADPQARAGSGRWADNLAGAAYLDLDLEAVGLGPEGRVSVDVVTGDWLRYHALSPELLPGGQRQRVRLALGDDSPLEPVQWDLKAEPAASAPISRGPQSAEAPAAKKELPPWRGYRMRRIREIVVSFHRPGGRVQAKIYGMAIHPTRPGEARAAAGVKPLEPVGSEPTAAVCGALLSLDTQVQPEPLNPYDLEEVDLRLAVKPEGGPALEIPAFWYEPESLGTRAMTIGGNPVEAEAIEPAGVGRFRAWWRPAAAGRYSLEWRLYRGSRFVVTKTEVFDYRYDAQGEGRPFPRKDYMERALNEDNRFLQSGPQLYGAKEANRPVERLTFIDGTVIARANAGVVTVAGGVAPKYVRVAATDPRQFELSDGSVYYPIGVNARSPSDARVPFKVAKDGRYDAAFFETLDKRATRQFDDFFASYAGHGINWARVWMSSWWLALEWRRDFPGYGGVGDYNQAHAARLDHLLTAAEQRGIYLQVTLNNHGMFSPEIDTQWADNPYNAELGGPCQSMQDFFSRAEPQKWHLMRLRYIAARWGQSPAVHGWEICSEVEFVGEYSAHYFDYERGLSGRSAAVLDDWHRSVADWLKRWDVQGHHLVTTHYSHPYQGQSTLALKAMEVPMANAYSAYPDLYSNGKDPKNECRASVAADAYWNGFRDPNSQGVFKGFKQYGKPVLVGEHGRHWMGVDMRYKIGTPNTPANLVADMHCMLWAMYMRPYAGDTGFWWWLPLHFEPGWLDHYAALARFAAGEDRRGRTWDRSDGRCDREALGCMGLIDTAAGRGYAWVFEQGIEQDLGAATAQSGATVTLPFPPGTYVVEFWRTGWGTGPAPAASVAGDGGLKIETQEITVPAGQDGMAVPLPAFKGDVALKIRRADERAPQ